MIVPLIGAIRGVETNNFWNSVDSLFTSVYLLHILLSHALILKFFSGARSNDKQNRALESKLQPLQLC